MILQVGDETCMFPMTGKWNLMEIPQVLLHRKSDGVSATKSGWKNKQYGRLPRTKQWLIILEYMYVLKHIYIHHQHCIIELIGTTVPVQISKTQTSQKNTFNLWMT